MNLMRLNFLVAIMSIAFCANSETSVDVSVGSKESEWGALMGSRCDIYSGCPECVGPLWIPVSGTVVVDAANMQSGLLGADIRMALDSVERKLSGVAHRIRVEPSGVGVPRRTKQGGVVGRVLAAPRMYIDAVADGTDTLPDFLQRGIDAFCKPHGKAMEFASSVHIDWKSGRRCNRACFVCEDGWMVMVFGLVGAKAVYGVECLIREGKLLDVRGSCPVKVATGTEIEIAPGKDGECGVGMLCDESTGEVSVSFCGRAFSGFPNEKIMPTEVEKFLQDMKRYMDNLSTPNE